MSHTLEEDFLDFVQIQDLKGEIDISKVAAALQVDEEELFEFVNNRVMKLEEEGRSTQNVGESLGTLFLFGYWLRGVRGD